VRKAPEVVKSGEPRLDRTTGGFTRGCERAHKERDRGHDEHLCS
jgi:hypothetical protein